MTLGRRNSADFWLRDATQRLQAPDVIAENMWIWEPEEKQKGG